MIFPRKLIGFGVAGINRQQICGAILIAGSAPWTLAQRGIAFNEIGMAIRRFVVRYFPEVNDRLQNNVGETIARALSDKWSRDISWEGEVTGSNGVMAFALAAACSFANNVADYGDGSGRILVDEVTVSQERAGWKSADGRASSNPQLV